MNKLGQGLAVGISAICSMFIGMVGIAYTKEPGCLAVMIVPVLVALFITVCDGWD